MKFLDRIFGRETRDATARTSDPYLAEFFGMRGGGAGFVNADQASGLAVAQACISIISQSLASVPLSLYRRTANGGREKADDHPLYGVLHDQASDGLTAFEVRESLVASLMIFGNGFAEKIWNGRGQVVALVPLDHHSVAVERLESGRLRYRVSNTRGGTRVLLQEEMLHLRYRLAKDRALGISPIQMARETFDLALSQQRTAVTHARKGFRPEGALVFPNQVSGANAEVALSRLKARIESESSTSGVFVFDGGVDWKPFAFSSKDAEFLESRKLTNLDVCRIWNVPPTSVGILDHGTYSNVESESRALVVRCLAPMAKRLEQSMNMALLPDGRSGLFIEHDLQGLLRGDLQARYAAYRVGRDGGWLSSNEIRSWENMPSIDGGDEYLKPLNMANLGDPPVAPTKPA